MIVTANVHPDEDTRVEAQNSGRLTWLTIAGGLDDITIFVPDIEFIEKMRRALDDAEANLRA